jgi:DNA-binding NarL/FixJ family response regulator
MIASSSLRLLIVDSVPVLLEGLTSLLKGRREFQVAAAADAFYLPPIALSTPIDVAIVDVAAKTHDGWRDVRRVQETLPAARIVVMDEIVRDHQLRRAMRQSLGGFIAKFDPIENITETLLEIRKSDFIVSQSVLECGYSTGRVHDSARGNALGLHLLTQREVDVLRHIGDGLPMKDIASRLRISECTLDNHKTRILRKLGMHRIVDLVRFAIGSGLSIIDETNCLPPVTETASTSITPPPKAGARR